MLSNDHQNLSNSLEKNVNPTFHQRIKAKCTWKESTNTNVIYAEHKSYNISMLQYRSMHNQKKYFTD